MADIRSDFEADVRILNELLRWTDNVSLVAASTLLVLVSWWLWP